MRYAHTARLLRTIGAHKSSAQKGRNVIVWGGVMPRDWQLTPLSSIAKFVGGYSYKGNELQPSNIAMAIIKNFESRRGFKLNGYKEIVPSDRLRKEHYLQLFDTIVAYTDLTQNADVIGNAEMILSKSHYNKIVFSMDVVKVIPTKHIPKFLLSSILQSKQFKSHCLGYVNGTTVLHLSKNALNDYKCFLPSDEKILSKINAVLEELFTKRALIYEENRHLSAIRDTLLPKLMSGELDVSEVRV